MRTTRVSALPYWLWPSWCAMGNSAPSIGGVGERAEEEGDVVVPVVGDTEDDADLGEEAGRVGRVGVGVEDQPVHPGLQRRRGQTGDPSVVVGGPAAERGPLRTPRRSPVQRDRHAGGGGAGDGVE